MATRHAKLYQGEDLSPVIDYTDQVIWEESEFGTRAWQGEGSASTVVIRDPQGEQGNSADLPSGLTSRSLASKNLFVIDLDDDIIYRGRVGIKNYGRDGQQVERYRQVEVSLHDTHWDLDHIFVNAYSRPSETGNARIQGIIASYLSGNPRPTTQLNGSNYLSGSNTITLEAQTFNRTTPLQMIRDTATAENKQFFITGDTLGGGSIFYDGNDSTIYASDIRISDRIADQSVALTFPPIWNVGPASTEDGSQQLCEVVLFYGSADDQYVTAHNLTVHTQYGHSSETFTDDTIVDATAAQRRANAILAHRQYEDKTYNVTIGPLTDTEVLKVKHGQTINIKARAIPDADDQFRLMRIVQCRYTTPVIGVWFAHLQLGRPWKIEPYGTGTPTQPKAPMPGSSGSTFVDWTWSTATGSTGFNAWKQPVAAYPAISQAAFDMNNGLNNTEANYRSENPNNQIPREGSAARFIPCTAGEEFTYAFDLSQRSSSAGTRRMKIIWYNASGVGLSENTLYSDTGLGFIHVEGAITPPTNAVMFQFDVAGRCDNVICSTAGTSGTPASLDPDTIGTDSGFYANADHVHNHDDILARSAAEQHPASSLTEDNFGDVQTAITTLKDAEGIAIADAGGYFTATDVEGALQELGSGDGLGLINVKTYGATGDGTTDDTTAVQAAIDACPAYGTVFFPTGTYKITATLTIPVAIRLLGASAYPNWYAQASVISMATANTTAISATVFETEIHIENLEILGPGSATSGYGIYSTVNVNLTHVKVKGFYDGICIDDSGVNPSAFYNHIFQSWIDTNAHAGLLLHTKTNNTSVIETYFAFNQYGLLADGGAWGLRLFGNSFEMNTAAGVSIDGTGAAQSTSGVLISGNYFEHLASGGSPIADLEIGPTTVVKGVVIDGNVFVASDIATLWHIDLEFCERVTIVGNFIGSNSEAGAIRGTGDSNNVTLLNNHAVGAINLPSDARNLDVSDVTADNVSAVGRWEPVTNGVDTFVWDGSEILVHFVETP